MWHERLKARMKAVGLNPTELARRSGVPYHSVAKYVRTNIDKRVAKPRGDVIQKLAEAVEDTFEKLRPLGVETQRPTSSGGTRRLLGS